MSVIPLKAMQEDTYREKLLEMGAAQMEKDRARIKELEKALDFYRDAYEHHFKRSQAQEKALDRLYEREALHTESEGMRGQEIRSLKALLGRCLREIPPEYIPGDIYSQLQREGKA